MKTPSEKSSNEDHAKYHNTKLAAMWSTDHGLEAVYSALGHKGLTARSYLFTFVFSVNSSFLQGHTTKLEVTSLFETQLC